MYEDFINEEQDTDRVGTEHILPAHTRRDYPNIALALAGRFGSKAAKTKPIPPASISLRCGNSGVCFTVTPQGADRIIQGFIAEPVAILDQIEQCLAEGSYTKAKAFKK